MRFIHTADWQIGKPFRNFADKESVLRQARLAVIEEIGRLAAAEGAAHVLVAGDLYDNDAPAQKTLLEPLERMRNFSAISWHVISGNHDYHRDNGVWDRARALGLPPNVHLHLTPEPSSLGEDAVLLPAPLRRKSEVNDLTEWMDNAASAAGQIRIGLAHGSVQGFDSAGEANNPIAADRAKRAGLDYLALGDWHGFTAAGTKAWYSGTPEIDRFPKAGQEPGHVACVSVGRGVPPTVAAIRTGRFRWLSHSIALDATSDASLDATRASAGLGHAGDTRGPAHLDEWLTQATQPRAAGEPRFDGCLADIAITGTVSLADRAELDRVVESWRARLLRLDLTDSVRLAPSPDEIHDLAVRPGDPIISRVAAELVRRLKTGHPAADLEVIHQAIHILHSLAHPDLAPTTTPGAHSR